jgi:hypothetical protein
VKVWDTPAIALENIGLPDGSLTIRSPSFLDSLFLQVIDLTAVDTRRERID